MRFENGKIVYVPVQTTKVFLKYHLDFVKARLRDPQFTINGNFIRDFTFKTHNFLILDQDHNLIHVSR